ncbi:MAG TPA: hypothetical protein VF128_13760 [Gemmatimonadaceae bacterium]
MSNRISLSRSATALASVVALLLVSCDDPTGPRYDIAISLYEDSVWATRSATEVKVSLHVQISNQDARPVYLTPCLHILERAQGSSWQRIRVSPCPLGQIVSLELASGESTLLTLEYRAAVTDQVWPVVGAGGEYRAVISLTTIPFNRSGLTPALLSLSSRVTPRFQIRERTVIVSRESSRFIHPAFQ